MHFLTKSQKSKNTPFRVDRWPLVINWLVCLFHYQLSNNCLCKGKWGVTDRQTASCHYQPGRLSSLARISVGDAKGITVLFSSSRLLFLPPTLHLCLRCSRFVLGGQQLSPHLLWQTVCILKHTAKKWLAFKWICHNKVDEGCFSAILQLDVLCKCCIFSGRW